MKKSESALKAFEHEDAEITEKMYSCLKRFLVWHTEVEGERFDLRFDSDPRSGLVKGVRLSKKSITIPGESFTVGMCFK